MPKTTTTWRAALGALALALGAGALAGCDGAPSRTAARDAATRASCDWYAMCGEIGAGKTFETRDSCEVQVRSSWDQAWPAADCDGKINGDQLDVCLSAIKITECGNGLDVLNTLANKCPKARICNGASAADAGAGG